jgi:hypothetical protein
VNLAREIWNTYNKSILNPWRKYEWTFYILYISNTVSFATLSVRGLGLFFKKPGNSLGCTGYFGQFTCHPPESIFWGFLFTLCKAVSSSVHLSLYLWRHLQWPGCCKHKVVRFVQKNIWFVYISLLPRNKTTLFTFSQATSGCASHPYRSAESSQKVQTYIYIHLLS